MKGLLDGNENGIGMDGNSYVSLPAKQRVDSAFHINANFALDHCRNGLLPEHPWNEIFLSGMISQSIIHLLENLRSSISEKTGERIQPIERPKRN